MALRGSDLLLTATATIILYYLTTIFYNNFLHPLSKFKGPWLWKTFRLPFLTSMISGDLPYRIKALHDKYGSVVRVAPDELSFIDPQAWKDIYHNREFLRPKEWGNRPPGVQAHNFITAPTAEHARFRKAFQPAFSEAAVRGYEPIVRNYTDYLIKRLNEQIEGDGNSADVDMVKWFNYAFFDIIGDLGWGSSFDCLRDNEYHPWIKVVLHFKAVLLANLIGYYPWLAAILGAITPASALADLHQVLSTTHEKVQTRLHAQKTDRPDILSFILAYNKSNAQDKLSDGEIEANCIAMVVAGSETLTTTLTATLYNLLRSPKSLKTLLQEIHTNFSSENEITAASTRSLPYLHAVLNESMRMCPPLPDNMRRAVPRGGAKVAGEYLPEGITVGVPCWSTFQSISNFVSPGEFIPERWLKGDGEGSSRFFQDRKAAFQPFSAGPHNCIGQPLAWMEMRLVLVRLLWNFDIEMPVGSQQKEWGSQKIYWTWDKVPLPVKITRRKAM